MNSPIESNQSIVSTEKDIYDITFIGAGPVALYGMYYAGLRLMKSTVVDMLGEVDKAVLAEVVACTFLARAEELSLW